MRWVNRATALAAALSCICAAMAARAAESPPTLVVFAAGTLATPFRALGQDFAARYNGAQVHAEFGGSVKMVRQITDLHRTADVVAVADYSVIPKYLMTGKPGGNYASWYAGIARNAITFVYTPQSKFAAEVTPQNWYQVLARPGIEIGRSNPDTDPSGYQTLQMLDLASRYYKVPDLAARVLANAGPANMRDTETSLLSALQLGQIDYLAIYRSDARQHHLKALNLPPQIDLGDPALAAQYAMAVAHTKNGDLHGRPIVYAVTIPKNAPHPAWAAKYVAMLLGPEGRKIMAADGFGTFAVAPAAGIEAMPASLRPLAEPWPK